MTKSLVTTAKVYEFVDRVSYTAELKLEYVLAVPSRQTILESLTADEVAKS